LIQYDVLIRPVVYLLAIIVFWETAKRSRQSYWRLVAVMSALFVVSMFLSLYEASRKDDQVITVAGAAFSYTVVRALLENMSLFAIVGSLLVLLTRRLYTARREVNSLAQVAASSADAIVGVDGMGAITTWNRGAEMVFGYFCDEITGQNVTCLLSDQAFADLGTARERLQHEGFVKGLSWRMLGKGKRAILAEVTLSSVLNDEGLVVGTSLFIRDVTEQKEMEKELMQASKMNAMGTMAAGVVQEFSNLLTVIMSRVQMSLSAASLDEARAEFEAISTSARRAKSLTSNLLSYAKRQQPVKTMASLADAADMALSLMEKELEEAKITVSRKFDPVPTTAFDRDQVVQVFVNILMNAISALRETGGAVEVSIVKKQCYLEAAVKDNGPGIGDGEMQMLFEPFKGANRENGEDAGTGLGLFVCRQIVKFHNGNITVESHPGAGTAIRFYLPITSHGEAPAAALGCVLGEHGACRVAIIDKDNMIRELLAQALRRRGIMTETFSDSDAAAAANVADRFTVAFVDLSVRARDDARYVERLKGNPSQMVIGMIGEAVDADEMTRVEKGLFYTLKKPFGLDEINAICNLIHPGSASSPGPDKQAA
jgi:two-component system, cell cycle sensor histidine kinase and response regulator CckA